LSHKPRQTRLWAVSPSAASSDTFVPAMAFQPSASLSLDPKFLPNLPGYRSRLGQTGAKKQFFKVQEGEVFLKEEYMPEFVPNDDDGTSVVTLGNSTISKARRMLNPASQSAILNFTAYFEENAIGERPQVRHCHIYFYTEDGSIKVVEKPQMNSGVAQGTIVKRNVIKKPNGTPIIEEDFQPNANINIYGRIFT
jgi:hypothetical protein